MNVRQLLSPVCISFLFLVFFQAGPAWSANYSDGVLSDNILGFQIKVPAHWNRQEMNNGGSTTNMFVTPDENVAVAVTTFPGKGKAGHDELLDTFQQTALSSAQSFAQQTGSLNGLNGVLRAYRIQNATGQVITGAFAITGNGNGYVIWSMIPEAMYDQRFAEADVVMNTFILTGGFSQGAQATGPDKPKPASQHRAIEPVSGYHWFTEDTSGLRWQTPITWVVEKIGANPTLLPPRGDKLFEAGGIKVQNVDRNVARYQDIQHAVEDTKNFVSSQKGTLLNHEMRDIAESSVHLMEISLELDGDSHHMWFIHVERPTVVTVIQYDVYGSVFAIRQLATRMRHHFNTGLDSLRKVGQ